MDDISYLSPLYATDAPVADVYADTTRTTEQGAEEVGLRWRALRERLAGDGADTGTLSALDEVVGADTGAPGRHGQAVFASESRVLLDQWLPEPPPSDATAWGPIADPVPMLRGLADMLPYVLVVVDRVGAEIITFGPDEPTEEHVVEGGDHPITKVKGGGMANKRYQRRAEGLWEHNAEQVAHEVDGFVARGHARVLAVTGDVRAVGALLEHLGPAARSLLVELDVGESDPDELGSVMRRRCAKVAGSARAELLADYEDALRSGGPAVAGVVATAGTLRESQAANLVLGMDSDPAPAWLWIGPEGRQVATDGDTLLAEGVEPVRARAASALVRAAWATGADVTFAPSTRTPEEGAGARLRYSM